MTSGIHNAADIQYEPFVPQHGETRYELYRRLREDAPTYRSAAGYWVVSRHRDVSAVLADTVRFSSRPQQSEATGFPTEMPADLDPDTVDRLMTLVAGMRLDLAELMNARMLVAADPPQHTRLRTIVNRAFTPRRVSVLIERMREVVAAKLDGVVDLDTVDIVARLATPMPVEIICEVLSIEPARFDDVKRWTTEMMRAANSEIRGSTEAQMVLFGMLGEFSAYFVPEIERRRADPGDDILSELVRGEAADALSAVETILFMLILMAAGNTTTTNLIGNTVVSLLQNRSQLDLLLARPELASAAIEESARYRCPFQFIFREALVDVEIAGVTVPTGGIVVLLLAAANRDPAVFDSPDTFDITRTSRSLAFGHGIHFCLGAHLSRTEATVALTALLPHLAERALGDQELNEVESMLELGYREINLVRH